MWCDVMWCDVMWMNMMWCDVMWCVVLWCNVIECCLMWCDIIWCYCTLCDVMWCEWMLELIGWNVVWLLWCDVIWCNVIECCVMWCDGMYIVMWWNVWYDLMECGVRLLWGIPYVGDRVSHMLWNVNLKCYRKWVKICKNVMECYVMWYIVL